MKVEWKSCFRLGVSVFLLYLCVTYWPFFAGLAATLIKAAIPLLIGCVVAYIINILMTFYEKYYFPKRGNSGVGKSRRPVCMVAAFVTLLIIVILLLKLVVPELASCVELLIARIPGTIEFVLNWLENWNIVPEDILASLDAVDWRSRTEQIFGILTAGVGNVMETTVSVASTVFSGAVTMLLAVIFSMYLLAGKEKIGGQVNKVMKRYMKEKLYTRCCYILSILNECFHKYIVGQCIEALILGTLCAVGMMVLRLPYAAMIGALIAFTALIPVAGAYIGAGVGALMILTVSPVQAIIFLIYLSILQQLEGNLIYPKVVGSSLGLPAIWVLAAVTVGGGVMGIAGMLIGVPLAAAIYRLLREDVNRAQNGREQ